jgi:hypothetical protein
MTHKEVIHFISEHTVHRFGIPQILTMDQGSSFMSHQVHDFVESLKIKLLSFCDRTTSKMRGLSPKIISGDSRRSENAQTHSNKHTIPNMKFKLKLLQIKCHVLGFTKCEAQNALQKIIRVCGSVCLSRQAHALRPRRE